MTKTSPVFIHSKCCNDHWELVVREGIWQLECVKCGKPVGSGVSVIGPHIGDCICEECKKKI